jgi:hypothetical protein
VGQRRSNEHIIFSMKEYNFLPMPKNPERLPNGEIVEMPFLFPSRFESRETSQAPYDTIQAIVREQDVADFSLYPLLQNWPESLSKAPPSQKRWYVVALGNPPPEPLFTQVTEAINMGEPVAIPDEVTTMLIDKHSRATIHRDTP